MKRLLTVGAIGVALAAGSASAGHAEDVVKVGLIISYSGQFADTGGQMDNAIKLYIKQHGDTVAGRENRVDPQGYRRHCA